MTEIARVKQQFFSCQSLAEVELLIEKHPMLKQAMGGFYAQLSQALLLCNGLEDYALIKVVASRYHLARAFQWLPEPQKAKLKTLSKRADLEATKICRIYAVAEVFAEQNVGGWSCTGLFSNGTTLERNGAEENCLGWGDLILQAMIMSVRMAIACGYTNKITVIVSPTVIQLFHLEGNPAKLLPTIANLESERWHEFLDLAPTKYVQFSAQSRLLERMGLEKGLAAIATLLDQQPK